MPVPAVRTIETAFTGSGGHRLVRRCWLPEGDVGAVVVLAHGLGEHSGRYAHVARRLAAEGWAVWAHDHRGHGRSGGPRVHIDAFRSFVDDLETNRCAAAAAHPDVPLVVLGHSMGGAVALGHAVDHPVRFDLVVLTGPLVDAAAAVPAPLVAAGRVAARLVPRLPLLRLDAAAVSRDPAVVAAYRTDPLVRSGRITAGLGRQLVLRTARFPDEFASVRVPLLIIHGTADTLVPIAPIRRLVGRFGSADVTLVEEDGLFHEVLNEPERERVLDTIVAWVTPRLAPAEVTT